jgi:hypothetical protein
VFTHSRTSQHNGIDQHTSTWSSSDPSDTPDQGNAQFSPTSSDPFGSGTFGLDAGAAAFFVPAGAGSVWSSGLSASTMQALGSLDSASATISTPGSGLVFDNTYLAGCTAPYETCIVAAEQQLESLFSNSDTINVSFNEANSGNNGVALGNSYGYYSYSYATLETALQKVAPGDVLPSSDPSGGGNWNLPEAYARMLGLTTATGSPDLSVSLNTYYSWDFGQDVINGLTHELSEGGLGRVGGLGPKGAGSNWSTMDLFRYNAAGQADYSNGRDGDTTYFSSNGGTTLSDQNMPSKGAPTLSFNNQYDSSGTQVNTGDTADWTQENVFGSTGGGETLALTQTELDVLQALGWHLTLKQDVDSNSGSWETPTNWSTGSMPIEPQDVYVDGAIVSLDSNVLVNSVATSTGAILEIGDSAATTLIAVNGTNLNAEDTSSVASGNLGTIDVYTGSALQVGYFSETFDNAGTIVLGKGAGGSGYGALDIASEVDMSGGGTITLGQPGTAGDILNAPGVSSDSLVNVNNTISGGGVIGTTNFDNQADGVVEAQSFLQITSTTFSNEGLIIDEANATLDLGQDGATQSLANTGSVLIDAGAGLAVSGNYTASGSGAIAFKGAGAGIRSDGATATFINASTIDAQASGQIGDANLTFSNTGTTAAEFSGTTLTINTGSNIITNTGTLEAGYNATLAVASSLNNQGILEAGTSSSSSSGATAGTVDLGVDGGTASATNTGSINVYGGSNLAISGNYSVGGTGILQLKGAGAAITSDGNAPATFTNASEIEAFDSGAVQIGDGGIKATNDLTFVNTGSVYATGSSALLTINTGANTINDSGGFIEAVNGGTLVIDSAINTGVGGTIEADASGMMTVNGALSGSGTLSCGSVDAGVIDLAGGGSFGGAISGNGTVIIGGATTLHAGASLSAANVVETASLTLASVSVTNASADTFALTASSGTTITLGSTGTGGFTNAGTLLVNGAGTAHVAAPLIDGGTISITSGTLLDTGKLSGSGALSIGAGAVANLTAGGALTEVISGAGLLELGGAYTLAGGDVTVSKVQVNKAHSLSGNGTLAGALLDQGSVASSGGQLTIDGAISGTGTLSAGSGTVLDLAGGGSFGGTISGAGTVAIAGATMLTTGVQLSAKDVIDSANLKLASVSVTNAAGDIFDLTAASASTVTLGSSGTGAFTNAGRLVANGAGSASISAPFTNSGTVQAQSGTLSFLGSVAGSGTLDVGSAGTLSLGLGAASGQTVDFLASTGVLDLAHPLDFLGKIAGFGGSDQIFLANTTYTTFGFSNNLLTVKDGTATVASLNIIESSNHFTLTNENHGVLIKF